MTDKELSLNVIDREGCAHRIPALAGWSVMEIIRDAGLPVRAECGGAATCATCHVFVDAAWKGKIPPAQADEDYTLDPLAHYDAQRSRLSCQILMRDDLDGMQVTLAPEEE